MSGGSYEYLCHSWDLDDLLAKQAELERMSARLAGLGWAEDAARETEELLVMLRQWQIRAETRIGRLRDVWKAVEWLDSGDWSEDRVREALAKYRSPQFASGGLLSDTCRSGVEEPPAFIVTVDPRADAADVGRRVVDAIAEYESRRKNGPGPDPLPA